MKMHGKADFSLSVALRRDSCERTTKKNPLLGFCLFKSIFELNFALFGAVAVVSKVLPAGMMELPGNLLPYSLINKNFF